MADVNSKIAMFETFLNETLRSDLRKTFELRDKIYTEQAEYLALRNSINAIQQAELLPGEPLKSKVDLGCNFYCQARVADPTRICVSIGMGFFLEMTLEEALQFIAKKDSVLSQQAGELTEDCAKLNTKIKMVLGGLKELQNIDLTEDKKAQRDIFA